MVDIKNLSLFWHHNGYLYRQFAILITSNELASRGHVSILSEKSDENEDDNETVIGFEYTDEECDQNEDDYDSVPVHNHGWENKTTEREHDTNISG